MVAKPYNVLKIDELARIADGGGIEKYYRHTIKSAGGTVLSVDIDAGDFTPEKAGPILVKAATNADTIKKG